MSRTAPYDIEKFDWILFGAAIILAIFGLSALYSTSLGAAAASGLSGGTPQVDFSNFWKQVWFVGFGAVLALAIPAFDYRSLAKFSVHLYVLALILLVSVLFFGTTVRGTTGWFGFGGFGIQPVELVKLLSVIALAKYFNDYAGKGKGLRHVWVSGCLVGILSGLVMMQPDFGSAFLMLAVWGVLVMLSGIRRLHLVAMLLSVVAVAVFAWLFVLKPYQKDRVTSFLNPESDPLGRGYNVTQSIIAIGSGQLTGRGIGYGSQSQLRFLPERQTDFVFAVIAEEMGFMGVLFLCGLFGVMIWRGYLIAVSARDDFTLYLSLGIMASIAIEVCVNLGGSLRLLPVTGVTLPFVSYGGSSVIAKFMMVGVLESVAMKGR